MRRRRWYGFKIPRIRATKSKASSGTPGGKTAGGLTKDKSFGRDNSSGPLLGVVHEAVPLVENRPDSWAVRAFHGGRAGAFRDQAAAIRLAFGPIGL